MRLLACALAILVAAGAVAQEPDWTPLFNGSDFTGWQKLTGEWTVEGDQVVGRAKGDLSAWLLHTGDFVDFEFEAEFSMPLPANGGLQFRSHWLPKEPVPPGTQPEKLVYDMYGYQANIDPQAPDATGAVVAKHGEPPLAVASAEAQAALKPIPEWNTLRVRVVGESFEVFVNGATACRVQNDRYSRGRLAFQVFPTKGAETTEIRYRNVRMKDLGRSGNWRPLFNGTDLTGWKPWGEELWSVENGAILGRSGPKKSEGYLATEESFKDFDVRGRFKLQGQGNFGLFYHSTIQYDDKQYPVISGVQGEVDPAYPGPTGWIYESYKRGWLVNPDVSTAAAYALRPTEWNEIEIRSIGNRIQTWVNGYPVVDFTDPSPQLFAGSFALQLHTGGTDGIDWKDLAVKQ